MAPKRGIVQQYARYSSLALSLPASVFAGYAIGYVLDRAFGTSFLSIVFLFIGIAAGLVTLVRGLMKTPPDE